VAKTDALLDADLETIARAGLGLPQASLSRLQAGLSVASAGREAANVR
jgi:hypothetical protein